MFFFAFVMKLNRELTFKPQAQVLRKERAGISDCWYRESEIMFHIKKERIAQGSCMLFLKIWFKSLRQTVHMEEHEHMCITPEVK